MMRKIFGGAMAFSVVGAVLLGGVLAWQASDAVHSQNQVGAGGLDVRIDTSWPDANGPDGVIIGPNGHETDVALLDVTNTGTFNLKFACTDSNNPASCTTGIVAIDEVSPSGLPDETTCGSQNFYGFTKINIKKSKVCLRELNSSQPSFRCQKFFLQGSKDGVLITMVRYGFPKKVLQLS